MTQSLLHSSVLAFGWPGGTEWIILLILGLLIFGRRLPEVGRSLGKGIVEFKKGIKGIDDEIEEASSAGKELPANKTTGQLADQSSSNTNVGVGVGNEATNPYAPSEAKGSNG